MQTNMLTISVNDSVNVTPETYQTLKKKDIFPEIILNSQGTLLLESQGSHFSSFYRTGHHLNFTLFRRLNFPLFHHLNEVFHSLSVVHCLCVCTIELR